MSDAAFRRYDVSIDKLRDVTVDDIEKWKDMEAFFGVLIPMQRALILAPRKLWNGEITLEQLRALKKPWLEALGLDENGK